MRRTQIGHIEVRTDQSIDISQYIHKKSYDLVEIPLGPALEQLRNDWANLMRPIMQPLLSAKILYDADPLRLTSYAITMAQQAITAGKKGSKSETSRFYPALRTLRMMAAALGYLVVHSVSEFHSNVKDLADSGLKSLVQKDEFKRILHTTSELRLKEHYVGHPKMEALRRMCIDHFTAARDEIDEFTGARRETRVMVFCNYRAVVEEIVDTLNQQRPLIKATPFVGQGAAKGKSGMTQKAQLEVSPRASSAVDYAEAVFGNM